MPLTTVVDSKNLKNGEMLIGNGSELLVTTGTSILLNEKDRQEVLIGKLKDKILDYLKTYKDVFISDIMIKFDINYEDLMIVLNELKREKKIKFSTD